jgi:hypothetical protein
MAEVSASWQRWQQQQQASGKLFHIEQKEECESF